MGHATLITGIALFIYMGVGPAVKRQDIFAASRSYDKRNTTEIALAADDRNTSKDGPVSISQVTSSKKVK
jgi:hypothetical protein